MRGIHTHKVNGTNEAIRITAEDEPGCGGANHKYHCTKYQQSDDKAPGFCYVIDFQNGPIAEVGVNGITNEVLLAILIDRLQGFQKGDFACRENALALTKLEEGAHWLNHRTQARIARGVEGTHQK